MPADCKGAFSSQQPGVSLGEKELPAQAASLREKLKADS
jgi:hypothetical protein